MEESKFTNSNWTCAIIYKPQFRISNKLQLKIRKVNTFNADYVYLYSFILTQHSYNYIQIHIYTLCGEYLPTDYCVMWFFCRWAYVVRRIFYMNACALIRCLIFLLNVCVCARDRLRRNSTFDSAQLYVNTFDVNLHKISHGRFNSIRHTTTA